MILCSRSIENAKKAIEEEISKPGLGKYNVDPSDISQNIIVKKLDLADLKSVKIFAQDMIQNEKRIDLLVLNAGKTVKLLSQNINFLIYIDRYHGNTYKSCDIIRI